MVDLREVKRMVEGISKNSTNESRILVTVNILRNNPDIIRNSSAFEMFLPVFGYLNYISDRADGDEIREIFKKHKPPLSVFTKNLLSYNTKQNSNFYTIVLLITDYISDEFFLDIFSSSPKIRNFMLQYSYFGFINRLSYDIMKKSGLTDTQIKSALVSKNYNGYRLSSEKSFDILSQIRDKSVLKEIAYEIPSFICNEDKFVELLSDKEIVTIFKTSDGYRDKLNILFPNFGDLSKMLKKLPKDKLISMVKDYLRETENRDIIYYYNKFVSIGVNSKFLDKIISNKDYTFWEVEENVSKNNIELIGKLKLSNEGNYWKLVPIIKEIFQEHKDDLTYEELVDLVFYNDTENNLMYVPKEMRQNSYCIQRIKEIEDFI